jgi:hypothetical protein
MIKTLLLAPVFFLLLFLMLLLGGVSDLWEVITSMIKTRSFRYGLWMLNLRKKLPILR